MDTSWRQKGEENTWNGEEGKENKTARESGCCFQFHFHFNPLEVSEEGNKGQDEKLEVKESFLFSPPILPSQNQLLQLPSTARPPPVLSIWPQYGETKNCTQIKKDFKNKGCPVNFLCR